MSFDMSGIIDHSSHIYGHGIISQNFFAKQYSETGFVVSLVDSGTFVQVHSIRDDDVLFRIVRDDMQVEMNQMVCKKTDIINVPESLWGPLFTVKKATRLSLVKDRKVAEDIGNITVGHVVQVLGPDNSIVCTAKVTFRNSISRLGVGIYFGLLIMNTRENLQIIIEKVSLLSPGTKGFPRGCDLVVSIDKILPSNYSYSKENHICHYEKEYRKQLVKHISVGEDSTNESFKSVITCNLKDKHTNSCKKDKTHGSNTETNISHSILKKMINSDNALNVGDEVIYLDGGTSEKGIVRWIGLIENSPKIGVEFDNPINSVTGTVDGLGELFRAENDHILIVSPVALIKLSDYLLSTSKGSGCFNNNNNSNNNNYNISKSNSNNYNNFVINCLKTSIRNHNNNNSNSSSSSNSNNDNINNNKNNYNNISTSSNCNSSSNSGSCGDKNDHCRTSEFFYGGKPNTEDIYKKVLGASQFLKHTEKNVETGDCLLLVDKEKTCGKISFKDSFEPGWQSVSTNLDFGEGSETKTNYRGHHNAVDDGPLHKETNFNSNVQNPKSVPRLNSSSHDLYDSAGPKLERSHRALFCTVKKLQRSEWEDDFIFYESGQVKSSDKNSRASVEREINELIEHSSSEENLAIYSNSSKPSHSGALLPEDLGRGSVVELTYKGEPHFGVIRWIGTLSEERGDCSPRLIAGIEMEEEQPGFSDGTFNNKRYFQCNAKKALFVPLSKCRKDSRFLEDSLRQNPPKTNYGQIDCPIVEGTIPPINRKGDIESICGKNRGIQGHHNSCYLDATLFSMFAFTSVFDSLLYRPPDKYDIPQYSEVQRVLREEIVNPLRKNLYVRADRVMKLRTLLEKLSSVSGLTSEEKDPEEFLNSLLAQILKAEPFLKLSSGQEAFHYQLFVEKDERLVLPSVQQLFEQSFVTSDIKLKQIPSCLIIQMPRFGKSFKMYSKILPPQLLDVTDIIENSPRQCTVCGKLAEYECKDCFGQHGIGNGLESISFCKTCLDTAHNHHCRSRHNSRALTVPLEFYELQEHCVIPRLYMELFAVVCIETSHYVAFVKCGSGSDAPWCFFDSMADRKGEQNGYNIPEMVPCPDLPFWLSEDGAKTLNEMRDEHQLTEHAKRLFSDAYMCMYQSPDLMMYR